MTVEQLVEKYIDAWNRQDAAGILETMHSGAAYYDAFWMETCVGRDLSRSFEDSMREDPYRYERAGDIIETPSGCIFRYRAYNLLDRENTAPVIDGAEILTIRDGLILTVSDFYCSPLPAELAELAALVSKRHGLPTHTDSGLGALKALRVKCKLTDSLEKERLYLDPDISASQIAEFLDCTMEQLSVVISKEFGTTVEDMLDVRRIDCAKSMLRNSRESTDAIERVAKHCGFSSYSAFVDKFTEHVGVTPTEYFIARTSGPETQKNRLQH